jgi:hypothetical protein
MRVTSLIALGAGLALGQTDAFVTGLEAFRYGDYAAAEREFTRSASEGTEPRARTFLALTPAPVDVGRRNRTWKTRSSPQLATF